MSRIKKIVRFKFSKCHVRHCSTQLGIGTLGGKRQHERIRLNADKRRRWKHVNTKEFDRAQINAHDGIRPSTAKRARWLLITFAHTHSRVEKVFDGFIFIPQVFEASEILTIVENSSRPKSFGNDEASKRCVSCFGPWVDVYGPLSTCWIPVLRNGIHCCPIWSLEHARKTPSSKCSKLRISSRFESLSLQNKNGLPMSVSGFDTETSQRNQHLMTC